MDFVLYLLLIAVGAVGIGVFICNQVLSHRRSVAMPRVRWLPIFAIVILLPLAAHAQTVASVDPIGLITAIATSLPGAAAYLPMILAYLSLVGGICVAIVAFVPPPTTASASWWLNVYKVINFLAGNFGNARNAAPAGMAPAVRDAALASAKVTAAAPELATVAPLVSPTGAAVIVNKALPALLLLIGLGASLSACTAAQVATTIADGQLVCQVKTAYQAMSAPSGKPILAKGAPATAVQQVCALVGGAAVALPTGTEPAAVTIALPPSVTIPLAS